MSVIDITSFGELQTQLEAAQRSFLLLFKSGSESSECASNNLKQVAAEAHTALLMQTDVSRVRDIHPRYQISSAPTLLEFEGTQLKNVIKGCQDAGFLKAYFENTVFAVQRREEGKKSHSVTVYTTPTCSWCRTIKSYLDKNAIRYSEVDVSRDERASQEMVRKSGQQGVPQTLIDGQMVVGFDQKKIDQLLGIQ